MTADGATGAAWAPPAEGPAGARPAWVRHRDAALFAAAVVVVAALLEPSHGAVHLPLLGWEIPPLCGWRWLTGEACYGCGLTRAFSFMAHGDVASAWALHPLGPPGFVAVALVVPWQAWRAWRARPAAAAGARP